MSGRNIAVFGIYPTHESADIAVDTLRSKGFRSTDISVLIPQKAGSKTFGHEKGTKSAESAVAGGGAGAVIGGALGWLAGIGMLAIPGVAPFIAAGPIVATLAGWVPVARSAARPVRSLDGRFLSIRRSGMKGR